MRVSPQVKVRPRPDVTSGYAKPASDQEAMYLSALREALGPARFDGQIEDRRHASPLASRVLADMADDPNVDGFRAMRDMRAQRGALRGPNPDWMGIGPRAAEEDRWWSPWARR